MGIVSVLNLFAIQIACMYLCICLYYILYVLCNFFFLIVSKIRIERIASLFMLCWNLFKTAVISYSVKIAFNVLGKIIKRVILFLQERGFFEKLREIGGWVRDQALEYNYNTIYTGFTP